MHTRTDQWICIAKRFDHNYMLCCKAAISLASDRCPLLSPLRPALNLPYPQVPAWATVAAPLLAALLARSHCKSGYVIESGSLTIVCSNGGWSALPTTEVAAVTGTTTQGPCGAAACPLGVPVAVISAPSSFSDCGVLVLQGSSSFDVGERLLNGGSYAWSSPNVTTAALSAAVAAVPDDGSVISMAGAELSTIGVPYIFNLVVKNALYTSAPVSVSVVKVDVPVQQWDSCTGDHHPAFRSHACNWQYYIQVSAAAFTMRANTSECALLICLVHLG